ncbi:MAG: hypothetical protein LBT64_02865 [Puniceicoccales bacterium]|jgi:hypothetical protein|nr:hypothetical protein [Puniceicoccales bacterium]
MKYSKDILKKLKNYGAEEIATVPLVIVRNSMSDLGYSDIIQDFFARAREERQVAATVFIMAHLIAEKIFIPTGLGDVPMPPEENDAYEPFPKELQNRIEQRMINGEMKCFKIPDIFTLTPKSIKDLYLENKMDRYNLCGVHSINNTFGGPLVSVEDIFTPHILYQVASDEFSGVLPADIHTESKNKCVLALEQVKLLLEKFTKMAENAKQHGNEFRARGIEDKIKEIQKYTADHIDPAIAAASEIAKCSNGILNGNNTPELMPQAQIITNCIRNFSGNIDVSPNWNGTCDYLRNIKQTEIWAIENIKRDAAPDSNGNFSADTAKKITDIETHIKKMEDLYNEIFARMQQFSPVKGSHSAELKEMILDKCKVTLRSESGSGNNLKRNDGSGSSSTSEDFLGCLDQNKLPNGVTRAIVDTGSNDHFVSLIWTTEDGWVLLDSMKNTPTKVPNLREFLATYNYWELLFCQSRADEEQMIKNASNQIAVA